MPSTTGQIRDRVIEALGGYCRYPDCFISDRRVLTIDHKFGGGTIERKLATSRWSYYVQMLDHLEDYQLLCANHNHIKRMERREH